MKYNVRQSILSIHFLIVAEGVLAGFFLLLDDMSFDVGFLDNLSVCVQTFNITDCLEKMTENNVSLPMAGTTQSQTSIVRL